MTPARLATLALTIAIGLLASVATADALPAQRRSGVLYVEAAPLARALGDILAPGNGSLTWTSRGGTLTVFDGSPDALWQATTTAGSSDLHLSAPALLESGHWWLPADALEPLGVTPSGDALDLPDGATLPLVVAAPVVRGGGGRSEVDDLGHGVPALRMFAAGADGGVEVAVEVTDLDLLAVVEPDLSRSIDTALGRTDPDKPLLVVVTALVPTSWQPTFVLEQGGRSLELRYPYRMRLVEGSTDRVGPDAPASVVLLLPSWFDLYRPIAVTWQGVAASVTFRR